jgi:hypothetical protein
MRNLQQSHGSPKFNIPIPLNKTPTVVGDRVEMFVNITDMICQWEGLEEREEEKEEFMMEGRGSKRISREIHELSGRFEEGGGRDHISQTEGKSIEGEGVLGERETSNFSNSQSEELGKSKTNIVYNVISTELSFSNLNNVSTSERSRSCVCKNQWTIQRTASMSGITIYPKKNRKFRSSIHILVNDL